MSISDSTVEGKFDELSGKAKQAFGDLTGDQTAANKGAAQEVKGHGEQAWGSVKEAAHDSTVERTDANAAHDTRNSVTSATENLKDKVKNAVDDFKK